MQNLVAKTGESVFSGQTLITGSFIFGFVVALTIHQVLMKLASSHEDHWWYIYMGIGYAVGIVPPLCLTLAYQGNNPVIILAIAAGVGNPVVYITLLVVFRQPISWIQWIGIVLAVVASVLLTIGPVRDSHGLPASPENGETTASETVDSGKANL